MTELTNYFNKRYSGTQYTFSYVEYFLIFIYASLSSFETYLVGIIGNITKYIMLFIIGIFIIRDLFSKRIHISVSSIFLFLWFGLKCVSILTGGYNDIINLHLISQIGFVIFLLPFMWHEFEKKDRNWLLFIFWFVSLLFNILSLLFNEPYQVVYVSRNVLTLFGSQNDPNNCAAISIIGVAISLYCIFYEKKYLIINGISVIIGSIAIAISGSRAGLLALGVIILFCFFFRKPLNIWRILLRFGIVFIFGIALVVIAFFVLPKETFARLFTLSTEGGSGRLDLWKSAFKLFKSKPIFGTGWGTATYYGKLFPQAVHNTFVSMLAENGLFSLILFLSLFIIPSFLSVKTKYPLVIIIVMCAFIPAFFIDSINKRFIWNGLMIAYLLVGRNNKVRSSRLDYKELYYFTAIRI